MLSIRRPSIVVLSLWGLALLSGCCSTPRPGVETTPRTPEAKVVRALILLRQAAPAFNATLTLNANAAPGVAAFTCTHTTEQGIAACEQRCLAIQSNAEEQHLSCGCASHEGGCSCDCPD